MNISNLFVYIRFIFPLQFGQFCYLYYVLNYVIKTMNTASIVSLGATVFTLNLKYSSNTSNENRKRQ